MFCVGAFAQRAGGISIRATINRGRKLILFPNASPCPCLSIHPHHIASVNLVYWTGALALKVGLFLFILMNLYCRNYVNAKPLLLVVKN